MSKKRPAEKDNGGATETRDHASSGDERTKAEIGTPEVAEKPRGVFPPPSAPWEVVRSLWIVARQWRRDRPDERDALDPHVAYDRLSYVEGRFLYSRDANATPEEIPTEEIERGLWELLGQETCGYELTNDDGEVEWRRWNPNRARIGDVMTALRAFLPRRGANLPPIESLRDLLSRDDDAEQTWRIDGLLASGARALLAAPHKAGKSTIVGNLLRSLADGRDFLGRFGTHRAKRVVLIDDELDPRTLRAWLDDHAIAKAKRIEIVSLRGRISSFDILTTDGRRRWAEHIGRCDVLIVDCIRPILDALGLDENRDGGRFTVALDELLAMIGPEEGISPECVAVHHTGHAGERSRGDSRFLDWPDATWRIAREDANDPASDRFFAAFGRDVSVAEARLEFDPATRSLTLGEGSRKDGKLYRDMLAIAPRILAYVSASPGASGAEIERSVEGASGAIRQTLATLVREGQVVKADRMTGRGGGFGYHLAEPGMEIASPSNLGEPRLNAVPNLGIASIRREPNGSVPPDSESRPPKRAKGKRS